MSGPGVRARWPVLDAVKGAACLLIVAHHLALYGPLAQALEPLAPQLMQWLVQRARLAVQVFLVVGGYLAAAALAPRGDGSAPQGARRVLQRYARLALPYMAALSLCVLAADWARPWLPADGLVPAAPTLPQLLAHVLLLHDLLGYEALSAGVWYVAIDLQLFALAAGLGALSRQMHRWLPGRWPALAQAGRWSSAVPVLALAAASLAVFNRLRELDVTALYFFGAYGLGMFSWWIGQARRERTWRIAMVALLTLGLAALWLDWRLRIALALATAIALALAQHRWHGRQMPWPRWAEWLQRVGRISYPLFLLHFPILLLVSACVVALGPVTPARAAAGLAATWGLATLAAIVWHRALEAGPASWQGWLRQLALLLGCGALAVWT